MSFEKLLGRLSEEAALAKALPASAGNDDQRIQAAANGSGDNPDEDDDDENDDDDDDLNGGGGAGGGGSDGKPLVKSFMLKLDDGTDMEAFDGTELVKSLTLRVESAESALKQNEGQVLKSLNAAVDLISAQSTKLKEQGDMIKSMQGRIDQLAKSGRGRTSIVTIAEKPQLTPVNASQAGAIGGEELINKALGAMRAGRITGLEASGIENRVRMGIKVDPDLIAKVCA